MTEPLSFDDDDTGRLRTEASRKNGSDPGGELRGLTVAFIAHEAQDTRRHRQAMSVAGFVLAVALGVGAWAWGAQANSGADRARLEDVQARLVRIESQIDRLMERTDR